MGSLSKFLKSDTGHAALAGTASVPSASAPTQASGAAARGAMIKKGGIGALGTDSTIATSPLGTSESLGGIAQASLLGSS